MRILQVNSNEHAGGAAQVAWNLHLRYRARGNESWVAVGWKESADPSVLRIPKVPAPRGGSALERALLAGARPLDAPVRANGAARALAKACLRLARPPRLADAVRGYGEHYHPGSWDVAALAPAAPDVVHLHNLHGRYFDLRALAPLSHRRPVVLTLHDAWLLSGHCAHSFACERWVTGCGECPDLGIYPPMKRDLTAYGWRVKRDVFAASRLSVVTPSRWLMDKVERSMLAPAVRSAAVIPNGVDLATFRPQDRSAARARLGLPRDARIVLFAANRVRRNEFKDYATLRAAVERASERAGGKLLFVALGEEAPPERVGAAEVRFVGFVRDPAEVARHYAAADLYVHAARADTFPNTVVEALACGTPVVASAVGGIPEQVRDLAADPGRATGILVPTGDPAAMAGAIERLLGDRPLRERLGANAAADARARFDVERQADAHLSWYEEVRTRGARA